MDEITYGELVHNEQFIFVTGFSDKAGSHVYRRIITNMDNYAFTMVERCIKKELRDLDPKTRVVRVRFFPLA